MQLDAEMGSTMTERFNVAGAMLVKLFGRPARGVRRVRLPRAAKVRDIGVVTAMYGSVLFIALTLLASHGDRGRLRPRRHAWSSTAPSSSARWSP